jgi:hypothetical protein
MISLSFHLIGKSVEIGTFTDYTPLTIALPLLFDDQISDEYVRQDLFMQKTIVIEDKITLKV